MGIIELPADRPFVPGETLVSEMTLFVWPELKAEVQVGREWRIQEGSKLVGTGIILELLPS